MNKYECIDCGATFRRKKASLLHNAHKYPEHLIVKHTWHGRIMNHIHEFGLKRCFLWLGIIGMNAIFTHHFDYNLVEIIINGTFLGMILGVIGD